MIFIIIVVSLCLIISTGVLDNLFEHKNKSDISQTIYETDDLEHVKYLMSKNIPGLSIVYRKTR
jgi:hypothetical protein